MKEIRIYLVLLVLAAFAFTMFSGCAALQTNQVSDVEGLLTKAGFQKHVADTPQKLAHLKTLAQHRISRHKRHGKLYFVYADASDCQCLYAGGEEAFRHFRDLERQQNSNPIEMDQPDVVTGENWSQAPWGPFNQ
jgi:hypothetical protein